MHLSALSTWLRRWETARRKDNTIHSQPLIPILAFRQLHALPQTVPAQRSVRKLLQLPCARPFSALLALKRLPIARVRVAASEEVSFASDFLETVAQALLAALGFVEAIGVRVVGTGHFMLVSGEQAGGGGVVGCEEGLDVLLQRTLVD